MLLCWQILLLLWKEGLVENWLDDRSESSAIEVGRCNIDVSPRSIGKEVRLGVRLGDGDGGGGGEAGGGQEE